MKQPNTIVTTACELSDLPEPRVCSLLNGKLDISKGVRWRDIERWAAERQAMREQRSGIPHL